ncbi:hypothetical protein MAPG_09991 [Magnaporthiopsis poae ATCC 64411]|uniref:Uncharacterized protein n=1 Tax=Magnaporthiopsis poae (strain ATCC 64411 / 73-15) TaxID=644358 RepID=A0A0C4EBE4_MAGP6|nr:hypothetical protein MAPG_09991 [Magnaporthiopsis poae ATCC 64411]
MHLAKPLGVCIAATCALARPHDNQSSSSTSVATSTASNSLETITATRTASMPLELDFPPRDAATPAPIGPAAMGARNSWWPVYSVPVAPGANLFSDGRYKVDEEWAKEHRMHELSLSGDNSEGDNVYLTFICQYQCQLATGCESFFASSNTTAPRREGDTAIYQSSCQFYNARLEPSLYVPAEQKAIGGYNRKQ